jgi:hypothetical protein
LFIKPIAAGLANINYGKEGQYAQFPIVWRAAV